MKKTVGVNSFKSDKPQSNGFGSFTNKIVVRIEIKHVEAFCDAFGAEPFRSTEDHADFIVDVSGRYRGDDEGVLYEIDYALPNTIPRSAWSVLWGESTY